MSSQLGVSSAKELREGCSSAKTDPSPAGARVLRALAGAKLGGHAEYPGVVEP